jgi:hypothetical protein
MEDDVRAAIPGEADLPILDIAAQIDGRPARPAGRSEVHEIEREKTGGHEEYQRREDCGARGGNVCE